MQIGIIWGGSADWQGGRIYFENLARILKNYSSHAGVETEVCIILSSTEAEDSVPEEFQGLQRIYFLDYKHKLTSEKHVVERMFGSRVYSLLTKLRIVKRPNRDEREIIDKCYAKIVERKGIDFLFPLPQLERTTVPGAAWIPDLQHRMLPEFFTAGELEKRDEIFSMKSQMPQLIFSSQSARKDFVSHYPEHSAELEVWNFHSTVEEGVFEGEPEEIREKYQLPERYFLVSNQFWKHKDHSTVLRALAILRKKGLSVPTVFTGPLRDYRGTGHIDSFFQDSQQFGLRDQVIVLGFLSRLEQLQLMRRAHAVIQPSLFEGWSTVVEDCRVLGQRLIASDLDVHREQNPPDSVYFAPGDEVELAARVEDFWQEGGNWELERSDRESARKLIMNQLYQEAASNFLEIAARSKDLIAARMVSEND